MDDNYRYGGGADQTILHPLVALLFVLAVVCMLVLPRKHASLPLLWMALLVPNTQQIYVIGIHWFVLRLVVLVGLIRMAMASKGEDGNLLAGGLNKVDKAFLVCALAMAIAPIFLFKEMGAVIYEAGFLWDWAGGYFLFRWLLQDEEDVFRALKYLAVLLLPTTLGMVIEQLKFFNVFSVLGGLPATPEIREGKIRSQGVFVHSLMAGCFAAGLVPLFVMLWKAGKSKLLGILGAVSATVMMLTSNSSTPLLAYVAGVGAILAWPLRKSMRTIRWGIVFALIGLQLVMKAPVWFLIARVDLTGSSSSYHRAALVDQFIQHFTSWWLIGTNSNGDWGLDMWDVQNQYVNVGETGGLLALVFFILIISRSFGRIGDARKLVDGNSRKEWILWLLGCSLFSNVVGYFGVNYFDQSREGWFLLLAIISAVTSPILAGKNTLKEKLTGNEGVKRPWTSKKEAAARNAGSREPVGSLKSRLHTA